MTATTQLAQTTTDTPTSRKAQKLTLSRTKVSRNARYVRREFFARQMELDFLLENPTEATADELARAQRRFETIKAKLSALPRAQRLECSPKAAQAELDAANEDGEGGDE